jgi:hypothetical protein
MLFSGQVERRSFTLLVKRLPDSFQLLVNRLDPCIGERIREHLFSIEMKHQRCTLLMITCLRQLITTLQIQILNKNHPQVIEINDS